MCRFFIKFLSVSGVQAYSPKNTFIKTSDLDFISIDFCGIWNIIDIVIIITIKGMI